jgi:hypothetical protein
MAETGRQTKQEGSTYFIEPITVHKSRFIYPVHIEGTQLEKEFLSGNLLDRRSGRGRSGQWVWDIVNASGICLLWGGYERHALGERFCFPFDCRWSEGVVCVDGATRLENKTEEIFRTLL